MYKKQRLSVYFYVIFFLAVGTYIFVNLGNYLTIDNSKPQSSKYAILLMGGVAKRTELTAKLYKANMIKKIIFFRTKASSLEEVKLVENDAKLTQKYLERLGVPTSAIYHIESTNNNSTYDEAISLKSFFIYSYEK